MLPAHPASNFPLEAAPAIGFAILIVPLFDTLRVFGLRILDRRSPFSPDRTHVHHFLLDLGFTHRMVTFSCVGANIAFIAHSIFPSQFGYYYCYRYFDVCFHALHLSDYLLQPSKNQNGIKDNCY